MTNPRSSIEQMDVIERERDTAQSMVEAWAWVCEGLEAHLQDRVENCDQAKPETYLSILRSSMAGVQRDSEQIRAARWAQDRRNRDLIEALTQQLAEAREALTPFAAMGRVMETRAMVTFGKNVPDDEIVCQSIGEAGYGILTMGHFRDASALLPKAPGWGGMYRPPFDRAALAMKGQSK